MSGGGARQGERGREGEGGGGVQWEAVEASGRRGAVLRGAQAPGPCRPAALREAMLPSCHTVLRPGRAGLVFCPQERCHPSSSSAKARVRPEGRLDQVLSESIRKMCD